MTESLSLPIRICSPPYYMLAEEGDCVYLTFVGKKHSSVKHQMCGTITTRPEEMGVVIWV